MSYFDCGAWWMEVKREPLQIVEESDCGGRYGKLEAHAPFQAVIRLW
jgi:hypothetical protein